MPLLVEKMSFSDQNYFIKVLETLEDVKSTEIIVIKTIVFDKLLDKRFVLFNKSFSDFRLNNKI